MPSGIVVLSGFRGTSLDGVCAIRPADCSQATGVGTFVEIWLPDMDSNHSYLVQSQASYR